MNSDDIDKAYVSPYDQFLFQFDATHAKSASQIKEINKYKRIALMRDNKDYDNSVSEVWDDF